MYVIEDKLDNAEKIRIRAFHLSAISLELRLCILNSLVLFMLMFTWFNYLHFYEYKPCF